MRLKQEIRAVEAPNSLILHNNTTNDLNDISLRQVEKVSPETLSHRYQKGWNHLEESPDAFLNNNNNPIGFNENNTTDDTNVASLSEDIASYVDGTYRAMSSDDSDSSSDDESSASFSDTSPLLDVSSLGNSDASFDSDMSEDSSSSSSSSGSEMLDGCNNINNNNGDDDEEEMASVGAPSMQSSWMSFSSAASSPSLAGPSRGQVVLPDVLPVGKIIKSAEEDHVIPSSGSSFGTVATRNLEITFEKRRTKQEPVVSGIPSDRCLVEITAQPDVQVDIRVNPITSRPRRESKPISIKKGNTYPREARSSKRYLKNRDISAWIVNDSFDEHCDDTTNKYWTLGDGIRLNNFTFVNGYKTLSLTELVDSNTNEENKVVTDFDDNLRNSLRDSSNSKKETTVVNSYRNFERNYSKLPTNLHMCCKDNWRRQKDTNNSPILPKTQKEPNSNSATVKAAESFSPKSVQKTRNATKESIEKPKSIVPLRLTNTDDNSNKLVQTEKLPPKMPDVSPKESAYYVSKKKPPVNKLPNDELFEVYTMPPAFNRHSWAAVSRPGSKDYDWYRKRRNDREEIRRKLAMGSDTEEYISEKLSQHRKSGGSFDRLQNSGNLQICFMNEAAKDQDLSYPDDESAPEKITPVLVPKAQNPVLPLPSTSSPKKDVNVAKLQNNASPVSVTKRQRPKFFFNRPRSWHVSKQDQKPFPEEDLLTRHVRLQAEAREALAQAKDMARMQMEIERQKKKKSPIADIVGLPFPDGKNLLSHHALLAMNVAQLQVIVNDLHSQIETLNEDLVKFLLERDDLHMEQDSMLVDIEDLTRYLGLKGSGSVSSSSSQVSVNSTSDSKK
ncbi:uncharacterized protein [Parasteatoda tepidariorum]|uniref:uncharacterized protein isoform X2 n=2 Tax=Parasteatoda tepidariorum TaxID=114398 RepID=UPI001C7265D9|nr:uncharacterized protein LOC107439878 isoform X3 [Parasteatoda tepidariorum]